ncbi:MAG: NADH-quinone oxidoreductase subunit J [Anaerolineae bacterium]|jgi:NADH-quinone oxidoreductase subunit J|nr:NADH-quinone oxidoreductase subunit J [Anaerolineae bacterium]
MTAEQIIFFLTAALILISALMVVTTRNLVHAALWLVSTLFGVAVLFASLDATFLAVVQVVVYIGAIAILFIFAVMLTNRKLLDKVSQTNTGWPWAALIAIAAFAGLVFLVGKMPNAGAQRSELFGDPLVALSQALVSPDAYVLAFEVASIMLLAALVGAVYIANRK